MVCGKLVENNWPNSTRRKQLNEKEGRKTDLKLTRRLLKLDANSSEKLQITNWL